MILIDNPLLITFQRKERCELCKCRRSLWSLEAHHLMSRGAGRVDIQQNLVGLCRFCHVQVHANPEAKERLWAVVCRREGMTREEIEAMVFEVRRLPKGSIYAGPIRHEAIKTGVFSLPGADSR